MHVSNPTTIQTVKVLYKDREFSVITLSNITPSTMRDMLAYVKNIGDIAFIVDDELYFDDGALFNLTMKYCDEYIII
jgi:hypothetical protein